MSRSPFLQPFWAVLCVCALGASSLAAAAAAAAPEASAGGSGLGVTLGSSSPEEPDTLAGVADLAAPMGADTVASGASPSSVSDTTAGDTTAAVERTEAERLMPGTERAGAEETAGAETRRETGGEERVGEEAAGRGKVREEKAGDGLPSYRVAEVKVTATKLSTTLKDTPAGVTVVNRREIEANAEKNLIGILARKEGVNPGSYGSFGALELIGLRGGRSGRTPVVLDGVLLNNAQNGDVEFNTVPASLLERIEIVRGPLGSLHGGNGIAGVVNLVTVRPDRGGTPVSFVGVSSGSAAYRKHIATFGRQMGRVGMILGIEDSGTDGAPPYKGYVGNNFFGKLDYELGAHSDVGALLMSHSGTLKTVSGSEQKTRAKRVQLAGRAPWGEGTRLQFGVFGSDEDTDYSDPYSETESDLTKYGAALDVSLDGTSVGDVVCGGGFVRNELSCRDAVSSWDPATNEGYAFAAARLSTGQWLKSLVSVRADFHSDFGNELSPYGSVWHEMSSGMVWFSFGRGFNPPTMNDLFWPAQTTAWGGWSHVTAGNDRLVGESSWMGEVGSRFSVLNDFLRGGATCYASRTEDYIEWAQSVSFSDSTVTYRPENSDQVDAVGAEMCLEVARKGKSVAGANLTLQSVEDAADARLPYMPESRLNLWFTHGVEPYPELEVELAVDAAHVGTCAEPFGSTQGPYFLLEGRLSASLAGFTAFARLRNASDEEYPSRSLMSLEEGRSAAYYPMPGRSYEVGILWRLLD
ncbi:MAG: TonB-dependent receptor [Candidatus Eisenbacteria bacterium]|nr:TonB-dependent receptor [Candidatus Eisenbacteria bacterium]